jgi:hypothetical protein
MIPYMPAVGMRFDIGKIDSGDYGTECWKVFWHAIDIHKLGASILFEGDTSATLYGMENVYCIAIQSFDTTILDYVRGTLAQDAGFRSVAASPGFVDGNDAIREPLPEAGEVDPTGRLVGGFNARAALTAVLRLEN